MRLATTGLMTALLCASMLARPAHAQIESREAISLQNQILELRHQMQQGGGGNGPAVAPPIGAGPTDVAPGGDAQAAAGLTPQLLDRVSTLEGQVRELRGQVDQLNNQVQQQNAAFSKQIGDLGFAVQQGHAGAAGAAPDQSAAAPASRTAASQPAPRPERRTPETALQQGNAALARHDYAAAQAAAREVLAGPKNPRQVDGQFLLAQSFAGQRQYQQAATAYYDVYTRAPHSARAADGLLGVGASLLALGDKGDACQALQKLRVEFPSPAPRVRNAAGTMRGRAGCH